MPQYKLSYFDLPARGEPIRWIFHVAKVPFEDHRIQFPEWPEFKKQTKWGQMPVLVVDGKEMAQWRSICRFLARRFNLDGKDEWEVQQCDEIGDVVEDINANVYKFTFEGDPIKKAEIVKNLKEVIFPTYLSKLNAMAKEVKGDFLISEKLTWADIALAASMHMWTDDLSGLASYPELMKLKNAVMKRPEIEKYLKERA